MYTEKHVLVKKYQQMGEKDSTIEQKHTDIPVKKNFIYI